jgi:hypothetical protein
MQLDLFAAGGTAPAPSSQTESSLSRAWRIGADADCVIGLLASFMAINLRNLSGIAPERPSSFKHANNELHEQRRDLAALCKPSI